MKLATHTTLITNGQLIDGTGKPRFRADVLPKSFEQPLYTTYLASAFRSIRFGVSEAHGKGIAVQLNFLVEQGAFTIAPDGTLKCTNAVTGKPCSDAEVQEAFSTTGIKGVKVIIAKPTSSN